LVSDSDANDLADGLAIMRRTWFLLPIVSFLFLLGFIQVPGFAEISNPAEGEILSGLVTIRGTANHPNFQQYDLAFAYDPNPTDTWFPVGEPFTSPVQDDRLSLWDTTGISDGVYQLRLRVWTDAGLAFEVVSGSLQIRNYTSIASLPEAPRPTATMIITPEATALPASDQEAEPAAEDIPPSVRAFLIGAVLAVFGFIFLGIYTTLSRRALGGWGRYRMRRVHQIGKKSRGSKRD
jgi:hypothetical protein